MEDERYDWFVMNEKLNSLGDNLTAVEKRRKQGTGKIGDAFYLLPDKELSFNLISKFLNAVDDGSFNAAVLDVKKILVYGYYEHFLYVRIGSGLFYLSERGVDDISELIRNKERLHVVQQRASEYGIRKTGERKRMIMEELSSQSWDPHSYYDDLCMLSEKQVIEHYQAIEQSRAQEELDKND